MMRHQESLEASRALRAAAHALTAVCVRITGGRDAPELHEPVPADMRALTERIDEKAADGKRGGRA